MNAHRLLTVSALALGLSTAGLAEFAHGQGGFVCHTWNQAKTGRAVTHCVTWTRETADRMRAIGCDPSKMTGEAMRRRCAQMSDSTSGSAGARTPG